MEGGSHAMTAMVCNLMGSKQLQRGFAAKDQVVHGYPTH